MKITMTRNAGGHTKGDTIEVGAGAGQHLIDAGYAETTRRAAKTDDDTKTDEPKTTRGKRD